MTVDVRLLAEELIAIPSYVSGGCDEVAVMDWLANWMSDMLPDMPLRRMDVIDGRYNLYAGNTRPRLLFLGHVDTVPVVAGWQSDPMTLTEREGRLYGLGIADMKGSIAALLAALTAVDVPVREDIGILWYIDEEYNFDGMKQAVKDNLFGVSNQPELVISLDGGLEVLAGCRGLIKADIEVLGKSGHASNPANGVNVITGLADTLRELDHRLARQSSPELGQTTMNVAYMNAGAVENVEDPRDMQRTGNVIPNYASCTIELRTANKLVTGVYLMEMLRTLCAKRGLTLRSCDVRIELGSWTNTKKEIVSTRFLRECYRKSDIVWREDDPRYRGFIDVQMLSEVIDSPIFVIGSGGRDRHGPNESASNEDLSAATALYRIIAKEYKTR